MLPRRRNEVLPQAARSFQHSGLVALIGNAFRTSRPGENRPTSLLYHISAKSAALLHSVSARADSAGWRVVFDASPRTEMPVPRISDHLRSPRNVRLDSVKYRKSVPVGNRFSSILTAGEPTIWFPPRTTELDLKSARARAPRIAASSTPPGGSAARAAAPGQCWNATPK